jgi:atypical dual specificity phosphatase
MATFLSQIAKINDYLYLSSFAGATEHNCAKFNINCVITVCKEVPKLDIKNVEVMRLEVLDKPTEPLNRHFDAVADKINEVASRKGACLVHCVAGISRSASMVLVYLMKYHKMSLKDAHSHVKSKRPFVSRLFCLVYLNRNKTETK